MRDLYDTFASAANYWNAHSNVLAVGDGEGEKNHYRPMLDRSLLLKPAEGCGASIQIFLRR